MKRWRSTLVLILFSIPLLILFLLGAYALFERGWLFWSWWLLPICWGAAFYLARRGAWNKDLKQAAKTSTPNYWTDRDREAWRIVEKRAEDARGIAPISLVDPNYYMRSAQSLLLDITRFYHPNAADPIGPMTVTEVLTAAQLAIEDLTELIEVYVPGSRHLTIARWKAMAKLPGWYRVASDLGYLVSAAFGPATAAGRYLLSKVLLAPTVQLMQDNVLYWFYTAFLQRVGIYAIELNSGRLEVGAKRWRELVKAYEEPSPSDGSAEPPVVPKESAEQKVTISVIGQVKAGKSSLVNAFLGRAEVLSDVLPATRTVTRHELKGEEWLETLIIQDTVGYGQKDQAEKDLEETMELCATSDIVLLTMNAVDAARDMDRRVVKRMNEWFLLHPERRRPLILAVLTHIDLLSPAMEWDPPYEAWQGGDVRSSKDKAIRDAVEHVKELLKPQISEVIPVCSAGERTRLYGVEEWLIPAILGKMDDARAIMLLRILHLEADRTTWWKVFEQTRNLGTVAIRKAVGL